METYTLLPADKYLVVNKTIITDYDKKLLTSLYTPIIGPMSITFYLTLLNDLDELSLFSKYFNHHRLMSLLKIDLNTIKKLRESLESVGLLKTFYKSDSTNTFIYEIYSPLTPKEFFNNPILNVVLYNNVGKTEYERIKLLFEVPKINLKEYTEITKKMNEVYDSIPSNIEDFKDKKTLDISNKEVIDFDLLISSIPKGIVNARAFNKKTKDLINDLAFIYNIDTLKMVEVLRTVLTETGMVDKTELRIATRKLYEFKNNSLPTLVYRSQPEYLKEVVTDNSKRGQIIAIFENTTPFDFLKNKNRGIDPTTRDLKILEMLLVEIQLTPAVINVLIDYVLRKNNNRLVKNYIETIALQWKRANLKTASEAMEFAEKEHQKYNKKFDFPKKNTSEPVWFDKVIEKENITEKQEEELKDLLKEFE